MDCIKCKTPIDKSLYNSVKYCSFRCQRLYLKSQWRKRTREARNEYAREYRKAKNGGNRSPKYPVKFRGKECLYCGINKDLQYAHIKPLWAGGRHKWGITLCRKHHHQFDKLLRDWWKLSISHQG